MVWLLDFFSDLLLVLQKNHRCPWIVLIFLHSSCICKQYLLPFYFVFQLMLYCSLNLGYYLLCIVGLLYHVAIFQYQEDIHIVFWHVMEYFINFNLIKCMLHSPISILIDFHFVLVVDLGIGLRISWWTHCLTYHILIWFSYHFYPKRP